MKFFVILLVLVCFNLSLFFLSSLPESYAILVSIVREPTSAESNLIEEGYLAETYSLMPFGSKHFFYKSEPMPRIGEISMSRCMFSATFLPEDKPVHMTMKFPNDLIWPGMYDNSTFFSVKDQFASYADKSGNTVTNKRATPEYEKIIPTMDSEFTTIDLELKGEVGHVLVNMTAFPGSLDPVDFNKICPPILPPMRSDYYDAILPKNTQKMIAESWGFPPDTYVCPNNKIGVIKTTDGSEVCAKPESKIKLIKRGWAIDTTFYGLTKSQITDIQHANLGCKKTGNQTYCDEMIQDKIEYYLQQNALDTKPESVTENCEECKLYGCADDEVYFHGICMTPDAKEKAESVGEIEEPEPSSEPEPISDEETQLHDARKSLKEAYQNHVSLGPYPIQDVIVGLGIEQKGLTIDIDSKHADSKSINTIREEIPRIVGNDVKINYVMYDEPIERHIETVIPYLWNKILHQKKIAYEPKDQSYTNTDERFFPERENRVCSPLVAPNGTEFFISSTFNLEPFEVTGTYIDKIRPDGCHKIWKTGVIMTEPDRVTALWLENEN